MFPPYQVEGEVPEPARVLGVERVGGDAKSPWGSGEGRVDDGASLQCEVAVPARFRSRATPKAFC